MLNQTIAVGLGSNLGDSLSSLRLALSAIKKISFFKVLNVSSIFESEALLLEGASPDWNRKYLNAVVRAEARVALPRLFARFPQLKLATQDFEWSPTIVDRTLLALPIKI